MLYLSFKETGVCLVNCKSVGSVRSFAEKYGSILH